MNQHWYGWAKTEKNIPRYTKSENIEKKVLAGYFFDSHCRLPHAVNILTDNVEVMRS